MVIDHSESKSSPAGNENATTLSEAVQVGELEGLCSLRDTLAAKIEAGPGFKAQDQTAALSRQLRDVLARIATLKKALPQGSVVDDLAHRRDIRRSSVGSDSDVPDGQDGERGTGSG